MRYLHFDLSDGDDGIATLEALAATSGAQHDAVLAEARQVLDWAWTTFPHTHGPVEDGGEWDHDLQVAVEGGGWHAVTLTLAAAPAFVAAFVERFGVGNGDD